MNGLLSGFTIDGGSTIGRSFYNATTDGMIQDDAGHWSIEPYIPLKTDMLADYLVQRGELSKTLHAEFRQRCNEIDRLHHECTGAYHRKFTSIYASVDPDSDCKPLLVALTDQSDDVVPDISQVKTNLAALSTKSGASAQLPPTGKAETGNVTAGETDSENAVPDVSDRPKSPQQMHAVIDLLGEIMDDAGYRKVEQEDIEKCVGVASQWGVPLHVDLGLFEQLVVYARGDIMGTRFRRRLRKMYRMEAFEIPVYQRMVVAFQLKSELQGDEALSTDRMHLRMFKNIPKEDVDTLLPGARVRISGLDHVKIIVPSLGGFLMSLR